MPVLHFRPASSDDGFTPYITSSFSDRQPAYIVRELIQNSLDAAVEAEEPTAKMRFEISAIKRKDIPGINEYANAFRKARTHHRKNNGGKLPDAAEEVARRIDKAIKDLGQGKSRLLSVTDNGIGLNAKRINSLLADGSSAKSTDASGSYGVGHLAPISLSDLRYILYAGLTKNKKRIVSGKTILASHPDKKTIMDAKGYLIKDFTNSAGGNLYAYLSEDDHPRIATTALDEIQSEFGHGSAILIPAFNHFGDTKVKLWEIVSKVAAYNFAPAIQYGKLDIEVIENGSTERLDAKTLAKVLSADKDLTRAKRSDSFFASLKPSGRNAYSILQTITKDKGADVHIGKDVVKISLLEPSLTGVTRIDLFRNGMRITDELRKLRRSDFADQQPFHAVIQIDAKPGGEIHRLVRKAEGPLHDKIDLSLLSPKESDGLTQALDAIAKWIRTHAPARTEDEYTMPDYLPINVDDPSGNGGSAFSFWGSPTPISRRVTANIRVENSPPPNPIPPPNPDPDPPPFPDPPPPPPPHRRTGRPIPFRQTIILEEHGKMLAAIKSAQNMPELWLALRMDENADATCDRIWQDEDVMIRSLRIAAGDGKPYVQCEVIEDGRFARIKDISANTQYEFKIDYETPQAIENIIDAPAFRLELHRPTKQTEQQPNQAE